MELVLGKFVLMYLLLPVIGIILGGVMFFIAKKNELLSNKKLIFYFLLSCIIIALPALLGFIDYWFMPYGYIFLLVLYFFLGWYNLNILQQLIEDIRNKPYYVEFLIVFTITFVGGALFSLVFNLCNELQYGLFAWTSVLTFIFPSVFRQAYRTFMNIPIEVYKIWSYEGQPEDASGEDHIEENKIIVVRMELFCQQADKRPLKTKVKANEETTFGQWFKLFIIDYNKKSPANPIVYADHINSYGWTFYTTTAFWGIKKYIDPDLSFVDNKMKEHRIVIAKRTQFKAE